MFRIVFASPDGCGHALDLLIVVLHLVSELRLTLTPEGKLKGAVCFAGSGCRSERPLIALRLQSGYLTLEAVELLLQLGDVGRCEGLVEGGQDRSRGDEVAYARIEAVDDGIVERLDHDRRRR